MKLAKIILLTTATVALSLSAAASARISDDVIRIGFLADLSGPYADADGPGSAEAIKMAIADMGGKINGKKVEFITADHLNKSDIAAEKARQWFDERGIDMLVGGGSSSATIAMAKVAAEKKKLYMAVGTASERLTNEDCTPYTVHYVYDTVSLARGTAATVVKNGGKTWYFMVADYTFGHSMAKMAEDVVVANGGKVLGSVRAPLNTLDFSSFLLQAKSSNARILGLANAGGDTINSIKAASEFGVTQNMTIAGLLVFLTDIHSVGLQLAQNMYMTVGWYWDQDDESRAWAKRYFSTMKKEPTMAQAGSYSATLTYLNAVKTLDSDDSDKVMARMKSTKINDMFTKDGKIRPDGRMVYDMHLMQVKTPAQSKYAWDYLKKVKTIPGDEIYTTKAESRCKLWN